MLLVEKDLDTLLDVHDEEIVRVDDMSALEHIARGFRSVSRRALRLECNGRIQGR